MVVARRARILVAGGLVLVVSAAFGGTVARHLAPGNFSDFSDPRAESSRALTALERVFHTGPPNLVLVVTAKRRSVDDPLVVARGRSLTQRLARQPGVIEAVSYWTAGASPGLRSRDGRAALVLGRTSEGATTARRAQRIVPRLSGDDALVSVRGGGVTEVFRQIGSQIERDLRVAEAITLPVLLIFLIWIFGGVVAAALPLAVGVFSVVGTFLVLRVLAVGTPVSIFSLNLVTALGLGLAVDYSLLIVSRFRAELAAGYLEGEAIVRTVQTAGRTVIFSALTVVTSLAALLLFPLDFLRSLAYAGMAVVVFSSASALVLLPAVLATLGSRVDGWVLWRRRPERPETGFWHEAARLVMRRPVPVALAVVAVLLLLGAPFLRARYGLPDARVLPAGASSRQVEERLGRDFPADVLAPLAVVTTGAGFQSGLRPDVDRYAAELSRIRDVGRVDAVTGSYVRGRLVAGPSPASARFDGGRSATWLSVTPTVAPDSRQAEQLVRSLRRQSARFPVEVAGLAARSVDSKASIGRQIPLAAGLIALATFVVLLVMSGSVLVPVKALILNVLSLCATFGAMVWVFQDGRFHGLLDYTPTGFLDATSPIVMFCIAFGLSMDYEVFLLSRIKEEHDAGADNETSVAVGLERTGRIITAAAALMAVVFLADTTSKITFIKLIGLGLPLAILMDATLVRAFLVPAFMRLAGRANWWAPGPLQRLRRRGPPPG
jgi:RND superfamily putative drug exporter